MCWWFLGNSSTLLSRQRHEKVIRFNFSFIISWWPFTDVSDRIPSPTRDSNLAKKDGTDRTDAKLALFAAPFAVNTVNIVDIFRRLQFVLFYIVLFFLTFHVTIKHLESWIVNLVHLEALWVFWRAAARVSKWCHAGPSLAPPPHGERRQAVSSSLVLDDATPAARCKKGGGVI